MKIPVKPVTVLLLTLLRPESHSVQLAKGKLGIGRTETRITEALL